MNYKFCSPSVAPADLNEYTFYETLGEWCRLRDLNSRPTDYKSVALPTELKRRYLFEYNIINQFINLILWRLKG